MSKGAEEEKRNPRKTRQMMPDAVSNYGRQFKAHALTTE